MCALAITSALFAPGTHLTNIKYPCIPNTECCNLQFMFCPRKLNCKIYHIVDKYKSDNAAGSRGMERMNGDIIGSQISNQLKNMQQHQQQKEQKQSSPPHASKYGNDSHHNVLPHPPLDGGWPLLLTNTFTHRNFKKFLRSDRHIK